MKENQLKIGQKVVSKREYPGVPIGTEGEIVSANAVRIDTDLFAVQWKGNRFKDDFFTCWFGLDELCFLDVLEGSG